MLKRPITYTDFDGEEVTEDFYFNISKTEIVELEADQKGGYSNWIQMLIKTEDTKEIMAQLKRFILSAYGEKSPDGKHFNKSKEISERFSHHAAYDVLFWEIFTDMEKAATFLTAIIPPEARENVAAEMKKSMEDVAVTSTSDISTIEAPAAPTPPPIPKT